MAKIRHTPTTGRNLSRWLRRRHDFSHDDEMALREAMAANDDLYRFLRGAVGNEVARRAMLYQEKNGPLVRITPRPETPKS